MKEHDGVDHLGRGSKEKAEEIPLLQNPSSKGSEAGAQVPSSKGNEAGPQVPSPRGNEAGAEPQDAAWIQNHEAKSVFTFYAFQNASV